MLEGKEKEPSGTGARDESAYNMNANKCEISNHFFIPFCKKSTLPHTPSLLLLCIIIIFLLLLLPHLYISLYGDVPGTAVDIYTLYIRLSLQHWPENRCTDINDLYII